ncbi:tetratricopeptide repeat protein [Streptomyces sp. JB150]|uniref:tetratricopeptide repeat protein n=1 Tax=Streptomyces sp. JB150 TaxID=2714844 RepID=UPI00140C62AA|nr:tetratricopeptide repeat protein [Streptomyces sp. JB150]
MEIAVGYVCAWLVGQARRVAGRADAEVDRGLDAELDRVHALVSLVSRKLDQDPALQRAEEEAETGREELTQRTRRRLADSLEDAVERDEQFAAALDQLVEELQAGEPAAETGAGDEVEGHPARLRWQVEVSTTEDHPGSGDGDYIDFRHSTFHGPVLGKGTQNNYFGRVPAALPYQVGRIPPQANCFQTRAEAKRLAATLTGGGTTVVGSAAGVLTGMGGVGKTQLAAHYARSAWQSGEVDLLVWITANNATAAASGCAQAGIEVCGADPKYPQQAAQTFLARLQPKPQERPLRWLIVFDDVTDPADMNGLWPPASPHGRTLVTTRRKDAALSGHGRRLIEVGLFTPEESLAYLTAALADHHRHENGDLLAALAEDLGHLPLALAQAAAYIIDSRETVTAYREMLADRTEKLIDAAPDVLPDEQTLPLAAAWSLSIERADTLRPVGLARPMLQLTAFLNANGIPLDVLTSQPALTCLAHRASTSAEPSDEPVAVSPQDAGRALSALHRLSLIDHTPNSPQQAVRVHQLIQRATRDALTPRQHDQTALAAADALIAAWPTTERDTAFAQTLRANAQALVHHAGSVLYRPEVHTVLYRMGTSLGETGQATAARDHFRRITEAVLQRFDADHPATLTARRHLVRWEGEAEGTTGKAYADLVTDQTRVLGADHPDTLATRADLARVWGEWSPSGGQHVYRELLADQIRVLGPDHPDTLATRAGLAAVLEREDGSAATQLYHELLADQIRALGADHPDTLTTRARLARRRGKGGNAAGAAEAYAELLAEQTRVLGADHPDTLTTRADLARWRGEAGDAAGAATAYAELLEHMIRVVGADHSHTLTTRNNLARWRGRAGDAAGAAEAYADLLEHMKRVLNTDHPHFLKARSHLAHWQGEAGDAAGAAKTYADLWEHRVRVNGPDSSDTLHCRDLAAHWRGLAGDAVGAAEAYAELLEHRLRVQGPDHPDILTTRHDLALWRGLARDAIGAAEAYAALLEHTLRIQGPDHPDILTTRNNLAVWRGAMGDAAGAAEAYAALLADQSRALGADHPHTLSTQAKLAAKRGEAGDEAGAMETGHDLLKRLTRMLGADHPQTLTIRASLARMQEDAAEAVEAYARMLAVQKRLLGADHPDTLTTLNNLAGARAWAGDTAGATGAYAELADHMVRAQGPDHPGTLATQGNLARSHREAGNLEHAISLYEQTLAHCVRALGEGDPLTRAIRIDLAAAVAQREGRDEAS